MKLIETFKKTSSHSQFTFTHKVKDYHLYLRVVAMNEERARKKAFAAVHDFYKLLKVEYPGPETFGLIGAKHGVDAWHDTGSWFKKLGQALSELPSEEVASVDFGYGENGTAECVVSRGENGELLIDDKPIDGKIPEETTKLAMGESLVDRIQVQDFIGDKVAGVTDQE